MQDAIGNIFAGLGSDRVIISPKGMMGPPGTETTSARLTETDLSIIKKAKGVKEAAGMLNRILPVKFREQTKYPIVAGIPTNSGLNTFKSLGQFNVIEGRLLKGGDRYKAVVGYELAKKSGGTYKKPVEIGNTVEINGYKLDVIGVRKPLGNSMFDTQILVPLETLREITGIQNELSMIHAIADTDTDPSELANDIKKELRKSRALKEGNEDFSVQTSEQLRKMVASILGMVQAIMIGIAAISLFVGGIGIMNTMYTSVLERTNEIGIMKAIGAKNSDILLIFLIESGLLGLIGGLIGVAIGIALSKSVELVAYMIWQTPLITANYSWWLILGALAFSFLIGTISGLLPAYQASKMTPVRALRYE
jgi:putative ABC transport system permease protein